MNLLYKTTAQRRWTRSAVDCYFLGCVCSKCPIYNILGKKCRMKGAVLELVRLFGKPERRTEYEKNCVKQTCFG